MLRTILHKLNTFEKYNKLVTKEGKRIFIRTVYTLYFCTALIILIWYMGIFNLSSIKHNDLIPEDSHSKAKTVLNSTNEQITLSEKITSNFQMENIEADNGLSPTAREIVTTGSAVIVNEQMSTGNNSSNIEKNKPTDQQTSKNENSTNKQQNIKKESNSKKQQTDSKKKVQKTIYKGENRPDVALTFDDGYSKKTVIKVLDVLKKNNVKATFFIIGSVLDDYPDVWKRAIDEGHQICNHTKSHATLTKLSDQQVKDEIMGWETCVKKTLGEEYLKKMKKEFPYLRLPGGGGNKSDRILSIAQSCGYKVIGWNLETYSSVIYPMKKSHTVDEIADKIEKHVVNNCSNGSIILLHFNQYDVPNLDKIVKGIKRRGYNIHTVTEVIGEN